MGKCRGTVPGLWIVGTVTLDDLMYEDQQRFNKWAENEKHLQDDKQLRGKLEKLLKTEIEVPDKFKVRVKLLGAGGKQFIWLSWLNEDGIPRILAKMDYKYDCSNGKIKLFPPFQVGEEFNKQETKEKCKVALIEWLKDIDKHSIKFAWQKKIKT